MESLLRTLGTYFFSWTKRPASPDPDTPPSKRRRIAVHDNELPLTCPAGCPYPIEAAVLLMKASHLLSIADEHSREIIVECNTPALTLSQHAFGCLASKRWLNDELINYRLQLLQTTPATAIVFTTFFYYMLTKPNGYDYTRVKKYTTKQQIKVTEYDRVLIPIFEQNHWTLGVINKKERKLEYYDSLTRSPEKATDCLNNLARFYQDECLTQFQIQSDVGTWTHVLWMDIPKQTNSCDCGMFMLLNIECLVRNIEIAYTQNDIEHCRLHLAATVLHSSVLDSSLTGL